MSDKKKLEAALDCAKRRWKVFPIEPGSFLPVIVGGTDGHPIRFETGGASSNPAKIRAMWKEWPDADVGLALMESGIVALYMHYSAFFDNLGITMEVVDNCFRTLSMMENTGLQKRHGVLCKVYFFKCKHLDTKIESRVSNLQIDGYKVLQPTGKHRWDSTNNYCEVADIPTWLLDKLMTRGQK